MMLITSTIDHHQKEITVSSLIDINNHIEAGHGN